jgi:hypothetical protein
MMAFLSFPLYSQVNSQEEQNNNSNTQAIEDNSFLIEEAYNQEKGVIQHIFNLEYFNKPTKDLMFSFTQEWPLWGETHQFSYTIPYSILNSNKLKGIGDVLINYRYQLLDHEYWLAASPRLSIIIPSGNRDQRLGMGVIAWQVNLPFSKRLSNLFVTHINAGFTLFPNYKQRISSEKEIKKTLIYYNVGASLIWLTNSNCNVMLECVKNLTSRINTLGDIEYLNETIVSPGLRFAINSGDLQIVPGVAIPLSIKKNVTQTGLYIYLSFEHPF